MMLADVPGNIIRLAVVHHVQNNKWFPAVSELLDAVRDLTREGGPAPSAEEAWAEVVATLSSEKPPDEYSHPAIQSAYERMGGPAWWRQLGQADSGSLPFMAKRFQECYSKSESNFSQKLRMHSSVRALISGGGLIEGAGSK